MTTQFVPFSINAKVQPDNIPSTSRGRALHTTAWFIHGATSAINYDNRQIAIHDIVNAGN